MKLNIINDFEISYLPEDREVALRFSEIPLNHVKTMLKTAEEVISYLSIKSYVSYAEKTFKKTGISEWYNPVDFSIEKDQVYIALKSNGMEGKTENFKFYFIKRMFPDV